MRPKWESDDSIDPTPAQALAYIFDKAESWDDSGSEPNASRRTQRAVAVVLATMSRPSSRSQKYGASAAQVLFHHVRDLVASKFGADFSLMVTPPEHDRIGDPSDGWGVHVVRDNKSLIVEHRNIVGLGSTLEGALCDLIELVHHAQLDDSDPSLWRERKQRSREALRKTLMGLGLHELAALAGDDDDDDDNKAGG